MNECRQNGLHKWADGSTAMMLRTSVTHCVRCGVLRRVRKTGPFWRRRERVTYYYPLDQRDIERAFKEAVALGNSHSDPKIEEQS